MRMKKVLFIVITLDVGGIENYLLRFLEFSKERNFEPVVLCKRGIGGELENQYLALGVRIIKLKMYHFPIKSFVKFYQFLKKERFSSVCDFTGDFAGITLTASKYLGVEKRLAFYRVSAHRFNQDYIRLIYNKLLNKLTFNYSTKILSNSYSAFDFFYNNNQRKTNKFKVIRNGMPLTKFNNEINVNLIKNSFGIPEDAFVIGHVGRYHPAKNHKTIIQVAENIFKKHSNVYFLLCGKDVKEGIGVHKLHERMIVSGVRFDIPDVLQAMDAFYFPSLLEGQPNALIEAMITGLPFVASNISTIKESVPENYFKYLTQANEIEKAANILISFMKKDANYLFKEAQEIAISSFNSIDRFEEFYNEI